MDAVKFLKEYRRICEEYSSCVRCPLNENNSADCIDEDPEKMVKTVEEWSKEHPIKTNGDIVTEMAGGRCFTGKFPDETEGMFLSVWIDKTWWDTEYKGE